MPELAWIPGLLELDDDDALRPLDRPGYQDRVGIKVIRQHPVGLIRWRGDELDLGKQVYACEADEAPGEVRIILEQLVARIVPYAGHVRRS